ncbi:O-acetylhomoserine ami [Mycena sp. CBHHK59/15]|nr:O-acetylhomoserine ami [Mycena sp. CBHHK59/15]
MNNNPFYREPDFETLQLHAGQSPDPTTNARAVPIYQSTSFVFNSVEHAMQLCGLKEMGNLYSRVANPTVDVFEKRMAALEGAATSLTITSLASVGDNIVASSTYNQFKIIFKKYGIDVKFVTTTDLADYAAAIDKKTKAIYVESISNSDTVLADIAGLAKVAHDAGIPLVVDNTLGMGGYMLKPISLGADIVGRFDWRKSDKFPSITGPAVAYDNAPLADTFFPVGFAIQVRIETLSLRAQRHCENALAVAKFLEAHPHVVEVTYLGLPSHQSHQLALQTIRAGAFGGMLTFRVEGGFEKVKKVINNLKLASHLANLGDAKTLVIAPFVTIQSQLTAEERNATGVTEDMIRYSVGIESAADIIADLEEAMKIAYAT